MEITILGPSVWRPAVARALEKAPAAPPAATRALLRFMHDRHVGLAPLAAARLAALLADEPRRGMADLADPKVSEPWATIVDRLVSAATPDETGGHAARLSKPRRLASLRLGTIPAWSVMRIAIPLVTRACDLIGRCYLFGGYGHEVPRKADQALRLYEFEQLELLRHLATSDDDMPDLFWDEQGFSAGSLARSSPLPALRDYPRRLPSLDRPGFTLLWRLRPVLAEAFEENRNRIPRAARLAFRRQGDRPREDGVAGVRVSQRLDDLDELSHSEHLNAGIVLLDRLVNTGFLVRHRPPPRQRRRDALIVGLMPDPSHGTACTLAKAAWFELALRLGIILQAASLRASDFIWIEAERLGGVRFHDAALDAAEAAPLGLISRVPHSYRMQALIELGWMPRFLDRKAEFATTVAPPEAPSPPGEGGMEAGSRLDALGTWMAAALGHVLRRRGANQADDAGDSLADPRSYAAVGLSDYRLVHAFVCWPYRDAADRGRSGETDLAQLSERLGIAREQGQSLSLLRMPQSMRDLGRWQMTAGRRFGTAIMPGAGEEDEARAPGTAELAAAVVSAWLDVALEALFGD